MWTPKEYLDARIYRAHPPRQFKRLIRGPRDDREAQDVCTGKALPIVRVQAPGRAIVLWIERDDITVARAAADCFEQGHTASGIPEQRVDIFRHAPVQPPIDCGGQLHECDAQILHRSTKPFRGQRE